MGFEKIFLAPKRAMPHVPKAPKPERLTPKHQHVGMKEKEKKNEYVKAFAESQDVDDLLEKIEAQRRPELEERIKFNREVFRHGKMRIDFIGVTHEPETLLQYRDQIESAILNADLVVLERSPDDVGTGDLSPTELADGSVEIFGGEIFYKEMERLAAKHGKRILHIDPMKTVPIQGGKYYDIPLAQSEKEMKDLHGKIGVAGMVPATALLVNGLVGDIRKFIREGALKEDREQSFLPAMNRRTFLKGAVYGTAALAGADAIINASDSGYYRGAPKAILHGTQDYRDVIAADGIDKLEQSLTKSISVAMIYGASHQEGIRTYLDNPNLRKTKRGLYKELDEVAHPEIRLYAFQKSRESRHGGKWVQTSQLDV